MDDFDVKDSEWMSTKDLMRPTVAPRPIVYDEEVSKIVGKPVRNNDPRLIKLIIKHKKGRSVEDPTPDNFLFKPDFLTELKEVFR